MSVEDSCQTQSHKIVRGVVESCVRRALQFPSLTVAHLETAGAEGELAALAGLESDGRGLGVLALPAAVEDSFYRYNNLPARLVRLYRGVDPLDPDEDQVEEAEAEAQALIDQSHLLDEVIDAIYQALAPLPTTLVMRRADDPPGSPLNDRRAVLLALKALFKRDWEVGSVIGRLAASFSIAVAARPVLVHAPAVDPAPVEVSAAASGHTGHSVKAWSDESGAIVRVE